MLSHRRQLIWTALGLLNSMVACGESHSEKSRKAVTDAKDALRPEVTGLSFGEALDHLKEGRKLTRAGWNGRSMWIVMMPELKLPPHSSQEPGAKVNDRTAKHIGVDTPLDSRPYIALWTARGQWQPGWTASQDDMMANDWQIVPSAIKIEGVVVLIADGSADKSGDAFEIDGIELPSEPVSLTNNFGTRTADVIGHATLRKDGLRVLADLEFLPFPDDGTRISMQAAIAGRTLERSGALITKSEITGVSVVGRNLDDRIPRIDVPAGVFRLGQYTASPVPSQNPQIDTATPIKEAVPAPVDEVAEIGAIAKAVKEAKTVTVDEDANLSVGGRGTKIKPGTFHSEESDADYERRVSVEIKPKGERRMTEAKVSVTVEMPEWLKKMFPRYAERSIQGKLAKTSRGGYEVITDQNDVLTINASLAGASNLVDRAWLDTLPVIEKPTVEGDILKSDEVKLNS